MKKLNKLCVLATSCLLLSSCSKAATGYAHYTECNTTLSGLFRVNGTYKGLEDLNSAKEAAAKMGKEDASTSLSLDASTFKKQAILEITLASYFGTYPLYYTGYSVNSKDVTSKDENDKEVTKTVYTVQFTFNFELGTNSYQAGSKVHDFFVAASISDLEKASYVSVLLTKEGKAYGGNSSIADYEYAPKDAAEGE